MIQHVISFELSDNQDKRKITHAANE